MSSPGTNTPGATLIPPAFGLSGVNLHTWTGWGSVPHWNGFVANLEMHGRGRFFDPRLNNGTQFPIAAANGSADLPHISPTKIGLHRSSRIFSSINCGSLHRGRPATVSTQLRLHAGTSSSAVKPAATTVTYKRCGPSRG